MRQKGRGGGGAGANILLGEPSKIRAFQMKLHEMKGQAFCLERRWEGKWRGIGGGGTCFGINPSSSSFCHFQRVTNESGVRSEGTDGSQGRGID